MYGSLKGNSRFMCIRRLLKTFKLGSELWPCWVLHRGTFGQDGWGLKDEVEMSTRLLIYKDGSCLICCFLYCLAQRVVTTFNNILMLLQ